MTDPSDPIATIHRIRDLNDKAEAQAMTKAFPYVWRVKTRLPERKGQRCRVNARGSMNSCEVEFEDGYTVITSRNYLRKAVTE